jgi:hypothetical protein
MGSPPQVMSADQVLTSGVTARRAVLAPSSCWCEACRPRTLGRTRFRPAADSPAIATQTRIVRSAGLELTAVDAAPSRAGEQPARAQIQDAARPSIGGLTGRG